MIRPQTFARQLALAAGRLAVRLLPESRSEWARAMLAEVEHQGSDRDACAWAIGCVIASSRERIKDMMIGNLQIPRWILIPEFLLCFVPFAIAWYDTLFGVSGIFSPGARVYFDSFASNGLSSPVTFFLLTAFVLGPLEFVGLIAALRLGALGRPMRVRWLGIALITVPAAIGAITIFARIEALGLRAFSSDTFGAINWQMIVLLSILPAVGAAHMFYLSQSRRGERLAA